MTDIQFYTIMVWLFCMASMTTKSEPVSIGCGILVVIYSAVGLISFLGN